MRQTDGSEEGSRVARFAAYDPERPETPAQRDFGDGRIELQPPERRLVREPQGLPRRDLVEVAPPEDLDGAPPPERMDLPREEAQERRLAGAVRPEDRRMPPERDRKMVNPQDLAPLAPHRRAADTDQRRHER